MYCCFYGCKSLVYLDIENWVINEECYTEDMFTGCDNLSLIKCSKDTFERILGKEFGTDAWRYENGFAIRVNETQDETQDEMQDEMQDETQDET